MFVVLEGKCNGGKEKQGRNPGVVGRGQWGIRMGWDSSRGGLTEKVTLEHRPRVGGKRQASFGDQG